MFVLLDGSEELPEFQLLDQAVLVKTRAENIRFIKKIKNAFFISPIPKNKILKQRKPNQQYYIDLVHDDAIRRWVGWVA